MAFMQAYLLIIKRNVIKPNLISSRFYRIMTRVSPMKEEIKSLPSAFVSSKSDIISKSYNEFEFVITFDAWIHF